jgi:hypothetical protein
MMPGVVPRRPPEPATVLRSRIVTGALLLCAVAPPSTAGAQGPDPETPTQPPPEEAYAIPGAEEGGETPPVAPVAPPGYGAPEAPDVSAAPAPRAPIAPRYAPYGNPPPSDDEACWDSRDLDEGAERDPDALPSDRCFRSTVEMVELYIYGAALGIGTAALGIAEMNIRDGGIRFVLTALGASAGILATYGLDETTDLEPGMPLAISSGILLGAGLGTLAAYALRPTPGDNSLVRSGAMWGTWYALMTNLILDEDDGETVMRVLFTGYNAGLVGAAILTTVLPMSRLRALYLDAGGLIGALAGGLFLTPIAGSGTDGSAFGWGMGFSSLAGIVLTYVLTAPDEAEPIAGSRAADDSAVDDLSLFGVPLPGGMVLGAGSRF